MHADGYILLYTGSFKYLIDHNLALQQVGEYNST